MDKIKLGFALLLLIAGIAGFYYLRESAMVLRVISVLSGIVLAVVVAEEPSLIRSGRRGGLKQVATSPRPDEPR